MLSAPLDPNLTTDLDKIVNELRLQYKTICCEFHVNEIYIFAVLFFFLSDIITLQICWLCEFWSI